MRFALDQQHVDVFRKQGYIEFEDLYCFEDIQTILTIVDNFECEDAALKAFKRANMRDLWRKDETLKRLFTRRAVAELAANLRGERPIRFVSGSMIDFDSFPYGLTLEQMTCIQGVTAGLMICLEAYHYESEVEKSLEGVEFEGSALAAESIEEGKANPWICRTLPRLSASGIFLNSRTILDFPKDAKKMGRYLLIVYAKDRALYFLNSQDPCLYDMKDLAYSYGDFLQHKTHPIVYR